MSLIRLEPRSQASCKAPYLCDFYDWVRSSSTDVAGGLCLCYVLFRLFSCRLY
uniref:Uncharacterized protein n=1 Tax=Kalanchoe fedtschenkoi TaxID=63787 RepID=A0A7N0UI08_KALFE